MDEGKIVPVRD